MFRLEVAPDSDLVFTNYALGSPNEFDPDYRTFSDAFISGSTVDYLLALEDQTNNFVGAPYPLQTEEVEAGDSASSGTNVGLLGATGNDITIIASISLLLIGASSYLYLKGRPV